MTLGFGSIDVIENSADAPVVGLSRMAGRVARSVQGHGAPASGVVDLDHLWIRPAASRIGFDLGYPPVRRAVLPAPADADPRQILGHLVLDGVRDRTAADTDHRHRVDGDLHRKAKN